MAEIKAVQVKDMAPGSIFLWKGQWWRKIEEQCIGTGKHYNCISTEGKVPDYALLDEWHPVQVPSDPVS